MIRSICAGAAALALAVGGSAALGGTALASPGAAPAVIHPAPTACTYSYVFNGKVYSFPCPAISSGGGTATNNCNANCYSSATGTSGRH